MVPSGSQSKQKGNDVDRATISVAPSVSQARISPATQSEHQNRPSCQRADSPMASPVMKVVMSAMHG